MLQEQINNQNDVINNQTQVINSLVEKVNNQGVVIAKLKNDLQRNVSLIAVKDCVFAALEKEVHRLQQYTRRYSVVVTGIEKKRGEKIDGLKKDIEDLIEKVESSTTMADVDKFHRNGPVKDGEQDVIIRFKSHSAKEDFYKKRKTTNDANIKIRPSLSTHSKYLLHAAQDHMKQYEDNHSIMSNRPEFVFANLHGVLQVKFQKATKRGLFVGFESLEELACIIANAQHTDQSQLTHRSHAEFDKDDDAKSDEDMGFHLFT